MKHNKVIRILFIENSQDEAEQILSLIRNTGTAVRPTRISTLDQLGKALDTFKPDVVLFNPEVKTFPAQEVVKAVDLSGRDMVLITHVAQMDTQSTSILFADGIYSIALRTHANLFMAVLKRELKALYSRRQVRHLESALHESERRCERLLDSSNDAIAYVHAGMHVRINRTYLDTFGYKTFDDLLGLPILDLIDHKYTNALKKLLKNHTQEGKETTSIDLIAQRADGSNFPATIKISHASFEGEACWQVIFQRQKIDPVTTVHEQRDQVTGLYLRSHILTLIDQAVSAATAGSQGQVLLVIEPDNWKDTVSSTGLAQADKLLADMATRLGTTLERDDVAGLLADHTFAVLLHTRQDKEISDWINRLQQSFTERIFDVEKRSLTLTLSIGGSLLTKKNANTELLLEQAGTALRNAQSQGSNHYELYDPTMVEKADKEHSRFWFNQLQQALAQDAFVLHHQRIINLKGIDGDYSEVLLRMHTSQGEVQPDFFIPIAEQNGLCTKIDRWVLDKTISALRARQARGIASFFFVRLSLASVQQVDFLPWLHQRLYRASVKPTHLILEMNESKIVTSLRPVQEFVLDWKKLKGQFALGQFGSGSGINSFQLLHHIQADYLKIDRNYTSELLQHPENQEKVGSICQRAHALQKQVIATRVEDASSTPILFNYGVDFVQGNFLEEPQLLTTN